MSTVGDEELLDLAHQVRIKEAELKEARERWHKALAGVRSSPMPLSPSPSSAPAKPTSLNLSMFGDSKPASNPTLILSFLGTHPNDDFSPEEIAKHIGKGDKITSIRSTLLRLCPEHIQRTGRGKYRYNGEAPPKSMT
jgi:hypothetical protein